MSLSKAIIFGVNGQDGYYLSQLLQDHALEVIGVSRSGDGLHTDITDAESVQALISTHQPAYIFHLAANSTTRHVAMFENHATISTGTLNILEAVRLTSPHSKVFISGSGLQFRNDGRPIKETDPFEARDPYSVSRIQSVYAARYFRRLGVKAYVGYFFNHDSPRRSPRHVTKMIADAVRRIGEGSDERLTIGDMDVVKEWTFAGDVVQGIWTLVQQDDIFEANIGSGKGHAIREWLEVCFHAIGRDWQQYVDRSDDFKAEYRSLVSDPTVIRSLGFEPKVSLEALAQMMLTQ